MPPPYSDVVRAVAEFSVGQEIQANVWHVLLDDAALFATAAPLIAAEISGFYNNGTAATTPDRGIDNLRATDHVMTKVVVTDLRVAAGDTFELPIVSGAGSAAGDMLPQQVALLASLRTAVNTRSGRGRHFLGGLAEGSVSDQGNQSQWIVTTVTDVLDAYDDLDQRLNAITDVTGFAVLSEADGVARRVTTVKVDDFPRTMKRRVNALRALYTSRTM